MSVADRFTRWITGFFTLWVIIFALLAFYNPDFFKWLLPYISILLGIIMFGVGITLDLKDFGQIIKQPKNVIIGVLLQFIIMPLLGFGIVLLFKLPYQLAAGVVLVGCVPSGTASNVMTLIAKGDVLLSVTVSSLTTLLSPFVTPYLYYWLAGTWIPINPNAMFIDIFKIIIVPIILGFLIRIFLGAERAKAISYFLPSISVFAIVLIISAVVAVTRDRLLLVAIPIVIVVVMHNSLGYLFAYLFSKYLFGMTEKQARAISFEVGMQNSGLSTVLAMKFLTPIAALPSIVFSVWHNISGSMLANFWSQRDPEI
ncbi:bile acid:Na+ symporter, BASS family [Thermodesulfobium acidiphilum]|uniref:Bile acid:Na+ symporter, BASS family n=1 Tax=Thermodesulfobium acidiphilum TaxID=1794699 RepID=A0A2R4VZK9_THEAF|nr:bile acid:sodium symporter family protein [Thermodesulfobium acidiphilum]AWB09987.1 bile acid:Na+ symporter, BASS family [Thermodesulfobium acidiphilum]